MKEVLASTYIDAKTLQVAFSSNLINKMYAEGMSSKNIIIVLVVVVVIILIFLQAFGVIDIFAMLTTGSGAAK